MGSCTMTGEEMAGLGIGSESTGVSVGERGVTTEGESGRSCRCAPHLDVKSPFAALFIL